MAATSMSSWYLTFSGSISLPFGLVIIDDPGFTMMFKEVPNMTTEEKASPIRSFEAVMKAREDLRKKEVIGKKTIDRN